MAEITKRVTSFQLGQVSGRIKGRVDLPGYHQACETLQNWLVMPSGGVERCPGTIYVANTAGDNRARLFPFRRKNGDSYVIEATTDTLRFFKNNAVLSTSVSVSPAWTATDFPELQWVQNDDDFYFLHSEYQPQKMVYTSDTTITCTNFSFTSVTFNGVDARSRVGLLYNRSLYLGSTNNNPTQLWGSVPESFDDFDQASTAFSFAQGGLRIQWIAGWTHLLVGTIGGEYSWGSGAIGDDNSPVIQQVSDHGSALRQPLFAKGRLLFVQTGGTKIREMLFSDEQKSFNAKELTSLADDILGTSAMLDWAFQKSPRPTVWVVRGDGDLAALTYDVENDIFAWSIVKVGGDVESIAVIPNGVEDQVWIAVNRTINGSTERHIEYFAPRELTAKEDAHYVYGGIQVDNGAARNISAATQASPVVVTHDGAQFTNGDIVHIQGVVGMTELNTTGDGFYTVANSTATTVELQDTSGSPANIDGTGFTAYSSGGTIQQKVKTITGLDHLEAETVSIQADGGDHSQETVTSGAITLDRYANKYSVGIGQDADLQPLGLDTLESLGGRRSVESVIIRVNNTATLSIGPDSDNLSTVNFRDADDTLDEAPGLFTGSKEKSISKFISRRGELLIRAKAESPLAAQVLSITAETDVDSGKAPRSQ